MVIKGLFHTNWNFEFSKISEFANFARFDSICLCIHGLNLILHKIIFHVIHVTYGSHFTYHMETSHQSEILYFLIFLPVSVIVHLLIIFKGRNHNSQMQVTSTLLWCHRKPLWCVTHTYYITLQYSELITLCGCHIGDLHMIVSK